VPKHSIVIPACNRFDYLWNTVVSCLASSDTDLELLINDDASDAESANKFYDKIASVDSRVKVFRNDQNLGVGTRLAELHALAQGEFIHVIGSDDLMHPKRLEVSSVEIMNASSKQVIWCSSAVFLDAAYGKIGKSSTNITNSLIKASLFLQPHILHPTVSYYHPDISCHHPYRAGMRAAVDYMYYIDNYTMSPIHFCPYSLTYLVHSSFGITRTGLSRSLQLTMHDFAMHRLWSKYVPCTLAQISILRTILVTAEYPMQDLGNLTSYCFQQLLELVDSLMKAAVSLNRLGNENLDSRYPAICQSVCNDLIALTHRIKDKLNQACKNAF
jgi:glycosyltransferase involved in cell wall biosynthesis